MIERGSGWIDAILSRSIVEPRFVPERAAERVAWLTERVTEMRELTESDWFAAPPELEPLQVTTGRYRGQPTQTLQWDLPEIAASKQPGIAPRTGLSSVTLHGNSRHRVWILLHGWLGGVIARDRLDWHFDRLLDRYDIAHVTLPGHGRRRVPLSQYWPSFPTRNPIANALGLALATAELGQLVGWLRSSGYECIGIAGTSIGAYVAALYATVAPDCDRMLLDRPLVRMSEPLRRVAARREGRYRELLMLLEAVYAPVNPLLRPARLASRHIDLLLGRNDVIVGAEAGQALAAHFGVTPTWFAGGHVLPMGRRAQLPALFCKLGGSNGPSSSASTQVAGARTKPARWFRRA